MILEAHIYEELANIASHKSSPWPGKSGLWPGDSISHATLQECESRGWAERNYFGRVVPTRAGLEALRSWVGQTTEPEEPT